MKKILALVFLLLLATGLVFAAPMIGTKTMAVEKPAAIAVEKPATVNLESAVVEKPAKIVSSTSSRKMKPVADLVSPKEECKGDMNDDGKVNFLDIVPFRKALLSPFLSEESFWKADCNNDTVVNMADLNPFVHLLSNPTEAECRPLKVAPSKPSEKPSDLTVKASSTDNMIKECRGDIHRDGVVDFLDIVPFREELGWAIWKGQYSWKLDCNNDGNVNSEDLNAFVDELLGKPAICIYLKIPTEPEDCKGDMNRDGAVNFLDVTPFTKLVYSEDYSWNVDYDNNGDVDMTDLNLFANALMHPPEHPVCR
ncbi:MAG: hypothetical protein KJ600_04085 [Nanoarchaeota archaeon]|nr:hypothetical protein [Nanoarchaeota archaeon]